MYLQTTYISANNSCFNFRFLTKSLRKQLMYFDEKVTYSVQISSPRVVKSCSIHLFLSPLLHEQIQIHR